MYTPAMRQAGRRCHSQESVDRELELQVTTPKSISTGTSESETDATPASPLADRDADTGALNEPAVPGQDVVLVPPALQIRVLRNPHDGTARCITKTIRGHEQDQDVILRLQGVKNTRCAIIIAIILLFEAFKNLFFMRHHTVWIAEVSLAPAAPEADVEDQEHGIRLVEIHRESFHPELTSALQCWGRLANAQYVQDRLQGIIITDNLPWPPNERRGALYLKQECSKGRARIWFICALLASAGVGLPSGFCTKNVGIGLTVGGLALAVLLGLQVNLYGRVS